MLAEQGIPTATLSGGTGAWAAEGHELHRPAVARARSGRWNARSGSPPVPWSSRPRARPLVHPAFQFLAAGIAGGLVFSAVTDTCCMAALLGKLPHNRPRGTDLNATVTGCARADAVMTERADRFSCRGLSGRVGEGVRGR